MADLIGQAHQRIEELEAELEELRRFIEVAERLGGAPSDATRRPRLQQIGRAETAVGSSPKEIVEGIFEILREHGETLDRKALIDRLGGRGITVPGIYANKNLGTILWRNQHLFEHLRGSGYKWTGAPLDTPTKSRG
jgi:hypothetical protein